MKYRYFLLLIYIIMCSGSTQIFAQNNSSADSAITEETRYRLFSPLNFSHSAIGRAFDFDNVTDTNAVNSESIIDRLLMEVYLERPDLVMVTDSKLAETQRVAKKVKETKEKKEQKVSVIDNKKIDIIDDVLPDISSQLVVEKPNFWKIKGDYYLQFMQNFLSENWYKGGESNYSFLANAVIEANYSNKSKVTWDNKLEAKIGFQTSKGDTLHQFKTSEDLLRYTGKLGVQATKNWYYTLQLLAYTQFMPGYKANDPKVYSDFTSPLNLNLAVGMSYKVNKLNGKFTGSVFLSPLGYNYRFVSRGSLVNKNGIREGRHHMEDFGSSLTADITWQMRSNLRWKSRLYTYTTYQRVQAEWENTFTFYFNKYITTNVFLYPRFDDNVSKADPTYGYFQLKEYASLGFSYTF